MCIQRHSFDKTSLENIFVSTKITIITWIGHWGAYVMYASASSIPIILSQIIDNFWFKLARVTRSRWGHALVTKQTHLIQCNLKKRKSRICHKNIIYHRTHHTDEICHKKLFIKLKNPLCRKVSQTKVHQAFVPKCRPVQAHFISVDLIEIWRLLRIIFVTSSLLLKYVFIIPIISIVSSKWSSVD